MIPTVTLTTGQVISAATGILACEISELYEALNKLTGDDLMTHQLPDASRAVEQHLREHCPWVATIPEVPEFPAEAQPEDKRAIVLGWVDGISHQVAGAHELPSALHLWGTHDALEDLMDKVGPERVIVVTADQSPESIAATIHDISERK